MMKTLNTKDLILLVLKKHGNFEGIGNIEAHLDNKDFLKEEGFSFGNDSVRKDVFDLYLSDLVSLEKIQGKEVVISITEKGIEHLKNKKILQFMIEMFT